MANIHHIEVIKGPASAITGRGEPGGVVNYVTKKPLKNKQSIYQFRFGIDNFYRGLVDVTGPLSEEWGLYYRVVGFAQNNDRWRDFESQYKLGVFPSLLWEIGDKTSILLEGELYHSDRTDTVGRPHFTVADPNTGRKLEGKNPTAEEFRKAGVEPNSWAPQSFQSSEPGAFRKHNVGMLTAYFTHDLTEWLSFRQSVLWQDFENEDERTRVVNNFRIADQAFVDSGVIAANVGDLYFSRGFQRREDKDRTFTAQGDLLVELEFERLAHSRLLTLLSYEYTDIEGYSFQSRAALAPLDFNNPVYGALPDPDTLGVRVDRDDRQEWSAYFLTLQADLWSDRIVFLYGYRYDDLKTERDDFRRNRMSSTDPAHTTADRWGVTLRPVDWLSLYHVESNQADPEQTRAEYSNLPPGDARSNSELRYARTGELQEWGIKAELLSGKLTFSWANFQIEQGGFVRNTQQDEQLPDGTTLIFTRNFIVTGSVFEGWEMEFFGTPLDRLTLYGGFSRIDTSTTAASFGDENLENRGVPDYKGSLFAKYDFSDEGKGFYVKGGFNILGPQWSSLENAYKEPGSYRIDLGGGYRWKNHKLDLILNNVTDEDNPLAMIAPASNSVGPPFQWFATFTSKY